MKRCEYDIQAGRPAGVHACLIMAWKDRGILFLTACSRASGVAKEGKHKQMPGGSLVCAGGGGGAMHAVLRIMLRIEEAGNQ